MKTEINKTNLFKIIQLGKKQGFLYLNDLMMEFQDCDIDDEAKEGIVNIFNDIGINIYKNNKKEQVNLNLGKFDIDNDISSENEYLAIKENESLTDNNMKLILSEIGEVPLLTPEQEYELARQCAAGDEYAKEYLIIANMKLVVKVAKMYQGRGVEISDLITSGYFGLKKGIEKFDYSKGCKLSTYATWWIRQSISRYIGDNGRSVRLPIHIQEMITRYNKTKSELSTELGREPSDEDIAKKLGISLKKLYSIIKHGKEPIHIDQSPSNDDRDSSPDISIKGKYSPNNVMKQMDQHNAIEQVLNTLSRKEADIIRVKYGLIDGKAKTLEETGNIFGITRERVRQIECKALRKLRHPSNSAILKDAIDNNDEY